MRQNRSDHFASSFVHLNVHSNYSMLEGASDIASLVRAAAAANMSSLALTDTDGLYAAVPFAQKCKSQGIHPVFGVELTDPASVGVLRRATLLARNTAGYAALCRIISERHLDPDFHWETAVCHLPDSVFVLTGDSELLRRRARRRELREVTFVELRHWGGNSGRAIRDTGLELARALHLHAVATNGVRFTSPRRYKIHCLLSALRTRTTLGSVPPEAIVPDTAYFTTGQEMRSRFSAVPQVLAETEKIASGCNVELELNKRKLPRFPVPGNGDAQRYLRGLVLKGLSERYPPSRTAAARRVLDRELAVIEKLGLADYFLICHDIVRHARSRDIPCVGRGSAANSIVSYCLFITHVEPIRHNLFFERFLNDQRTSLPDFDLDFGTQDRETILDHIFSTYGESHVAMIGTYVTFQLRGAFREVASALGTPKREVDDFIKRLPHHSDLSHLEEKLKTSPDTRDLPLGKEPFATIRRYAQYISGFPRFMATHPCGLVITPTPLTDFMPLQRGDKGLPITQWSMYPVEAAGLLKIDILGQKGLEVISNTIRAVRKQGGTIPADPELFLTDSLAKEWMRNGKTIGCFYIESPAMINLIRQARCDDFECLTALSSIIRPGVSNYGGKRTYLRRHLKLEPEVVLHPLLKPILQDTKGCLIYQEQVIRIASELAGLSLAAADDLRRLMSFKRNRKRLGDYREQFYKGCLSRGIPREVVDEIYRQVESFAGYAFCKAHSASFAMESFESMYYKSHYPAEFMAAVLSAGGGYYGSMEYLEEARRLGIVIHPPCINGSAYRFTGSNGHLRIGLIQVSGLKKETAEKIVRERKSNPYCELPEFLARVHPAKDEAQYLARCGAMRCLGLTIPECLWIIEIFYRHSNLLESGRYTRDIETLIQQIPPIPDPPVEQILAQELEILGLTPSAHPFRIFSEEIRHVKRLRPIIRSVDIITRTGQETYLLGWYVIGKKTRTKQSGRLMLFATFSDEWGRFEATFFPASFARNAEELRRGRGPFLLKGVVESAFGVAMLTVEHIRLMTKKTVKIRSTSGPIRRAEPRRKTALKNLLFQTPRKNT